MDVKRTFFNGAVKQALSQVWQTLLLAAIVGFVCSSVYVALNLGHYCFSGAVNITVLILCLYAIFVHCMADFIWEYVFPQIKSNYWCEWLASSIFFLFVVGGFLAFAIFLYESYGYWFAAAFTVRMLPLILGILLFISFIYKIMHD